MTDDDFKNLMRDKLIKMFSYDPYNNMNKTNELIERILKTKMKKYDEILNKAARDHCGKYELGLEEYYETCIIEITQTDWSQCFLKHKCKHNDEMKIEIDFNLL